MKEVAVRGIVYLRKSDARRRKLRRKQSKRERVKRILCGATPFFQDLGKKNREEARRMEEQKRQRKEAREAERQRKKEGIVRPRQQKKLAMEKENIHAGLSRFLW